MSGLPSLSSLHIDTALSTMSIAYWGANEAGYIASAFPVVPVTKESDKYYIFDKADFFRDEAGDVADGKPPPEVSFTVSNDSYAVTEKGARALLTDRKKQGADNPVALERGYVNLVTEKLLLRRDVDFAAAFLTTGIWTGNTEQTGVDSASPSTNQFGQFNRSDSDPMATIATQWGVVQSAIGRDPNTLIMGWDVYKAIRNHSSIKALLPDTVAQIVKADFLAQIFDVKRVLIPRAVKNTAAKNQTATMSRIVGKVMWLGYVADSPSMETPSAGYTFATPMQDQVSGPGAGIATYRHHDQGVAATWFDGRSKYAMKLCSQDAGVFFASAVG